jgi:hypothetical protein
MAGAEPNPASASALYRAAMDLEGDCEAATALAALLLQDLRRRHRGGAEDNGGGDGEIQCLTPPLATPKLVAAAAASGDDDLAEAVRLLGGAAERGHVSPLALLLAVALRAAWPAGVGGAGEQGRRQLEAALAARDAELHRERLADVRAEARGQRGGRVEGRRSGAWP